MEKNPKVFISYSHDGLEFEDKVLKLSNKLRSEGIDAILDQYETSPNEGWPMWMEMKIEEADFVLMLCTEQYNAKVMHKVGVGGLGVKWEGNLIYQHLYNAGSDNSKFIPVLFDDGNTRYIPMPMQGASYYNVDSSSEYNSLYLRLRSINQMEKPPLGKLKLLPEKERKSLFVTGFIDVELWNKASWSGTLYLFDYEHKTPPKIGIIFKDKDSAIKIFLGWLHRFGETDKYNELRISIIEGEIPGEDAGYTVHIGANINNIIERAELESLDIPKDIFILITRLNRMNPPPNSSNLEIFKEQYKMFGSYFLIPAFMDSNGKIQYNDKLRILKREIELRNVNDISLTNDLDAVIITKYKK